MLRVMASSLTVVIDDGSTIIAVRMPSTGRRVARVAMDGRTGVIVSRQLPARRGGGSRQRIARNKQCHGQKNDNLPK